MNSPTTVKPVPVAPLSPQDKRERDRKVRLGRSIVLREAAKIIRGRIAEDEAIVICELQQKVWEAEADVVRHAKLILDERL